MEISRAATGLLVAACVTAGAAGSGNGMVTYSVAPYTGRPKNRKGTVTIAGLTLSVRQTR